jgi:CMP-2-keto-3-deoxyoctulosonic acid synthetase
MDRSSRDELKRDLKKTIVDATNIASAINVGKRGEHSSVSSRQKVTHRDGVTTTVTETNDNGVITRKTETTGTDRTKEGTDE